LKLSKVFEVANVVELLDKDEVMKIGAKVVRGFETDFDSNYEWMAKAEQWVELAAQVMRQKTYPWPNASNVKYPLLTTAAVNFSARAYPAIVNTPDVVKCRTYGNDVDGLKHYQKVKKK
jgi:chaperonin GroES